MDVDVILIWCLRAVSVVLGVAACLFVLGVALYAITLLFIAIITGVGL